MTTVISSVANKGGVGKTTTIVNLAAACARAGLFTVVIDLDKQGNTTESMGVAMGSQVYDLILANAELDQVLVQVPTEFTNATQHELCIIPSSMQTMLLEGNKATKNNIVASIDLMRGWADVILIDTAPGFSEIHEGAYAASDYVILPTMCETDSLHGLPITFSLLNAVREEYGKVAEILNILPSRFNSKWNVHRFGLGLLGMNYNSALMSMDSNFKALAFTTPSRVVLDPIIESVGFVDARARALSIYAHLERINERAQGMRFDKRAAERAVKNFDSVLADRVVKLARARKPVAASA